MKKFIYTQNNSGGDFDYPEWTGPEDLGGVFASWRTEKVDVWVIAESASEANELVQEYAGVYFDGCDSGLDCECCGDRWYRADDLFYYPID